MKLRGTELRYVLTMHLARHGRSTIRELVDGLAFHGFTAEHPANKSVSDALRWERRRRAAPSTGFASGSWPCAPGQFATRRARRHMVGGCDG
jgi:hypothetical protein